MSPQNRTLLDNERTEEHPAQEREAVAGEYRPTLSAEQVYAQRLAESPLNGSLLTPTFIP